MKIRSKIIIIVYTLTVVLFALGIIVYAYFFSNYLENQENAQIDAISHGMGSHLNEIIEGYQRTINDYSFWDDTYAYLNNQKPDFIPGNFQNSTYENLKLNFVIFIGQDDAIKYHQYYDLVTKKFIPFPAAVDPEELIEITKNDTMPNIIKLADQYYIVITSQVTNTAMTMKSNGRMIVGMLIDEELIHYFESLSNGSISISTMKNDAGATHVAGLSSEVLQPVKFVKTKDIITAGFIVPHTVNNGASVVLTLSKTRDLYSEGMGQLGRFILVYTIIVILILLLLFYLLEKFISRPCIKIILDVTSLDLSKNDIGKLAIQGDDEFAVLGKSINAMLDRIEVEQQRAKKHENRLLAALTSFNNILNSIQDGFFELDRKWRFTYVNEHAANYFGMDDDDLIGKCIWDLSPFLRNTSLETALCQVMETRIPIRCEFNDLSDSTLWYGVRIYPSSEGVSVFLKDISERKQAEKALRKSEKQARDLAEKLTQADIDKNNFIAMLSHEIRNPLASIMFSLSLLDRTTSDEEQTRQAMDVISRQITQMSHLIDDLLDISRITNNKIILRKKPIALNALVDKIVQDYTPEFSQKSVRLEFETVQSLLYVDADETRLVQIVDNLLKNAVKFTCTGGYTKVILYQENCQAVIRIVDDGIGIEKEMLSELFQPFIQVNNTLERSHGGLGLGLAIVKQFTEMHGGSVAVLSEGLGKGTEFIIRLPLMSNGKHEQDEQQQALITDLNRRTLRVLIIDDIPDVANILCSLLKLIGHDVASASNGIEGLSKAKALNPDVIICDIGLPGMSGYDIARNIRADNQIKNIYLIALSGYAQLEDQERAIAAGFNRHLAKPVDLAQLERELKDVPI